MLAYPSAIDLSSSTLRFPAEHLTARRGELGTRWRNKRCSLWPTCAAVTRPQPPAGGTPNARLAAGFGIGIATVYRYIHEAITVLAALAPPWKKP